MKEIVLPELGEGITRAVVACWHYKEGEFVQKDVDIVELVTDKASFNVSSPVEGVLRTILVGEGENASIGQTLAHIEA